MEFIKRVVLGKAVPTDEEIRQTNTSNATLLEYLCVRKSKLGYIMFMNVLSIFFNITKLSSEYQTSMTKGIFAAVIILDSIVVVLLNMCHMHWYSEYTFKVGFYAFIINSLKLFVLFVPYSIIILDSLETAAHDLEFLGTVVLPWYVPYLTIMLLFKNNTYHLSMLSGKFINTWKVLMVIYIPINMFVYCILINLLPAYILFIGQDPALISVVYVLWLIGTIEQIATFCNQTKISNVLSYLWIIILLIALYNLSEGLYIWLISFVVQSAISGIKLNTLCKDVLCYTYKVKVIRRQHELIPVCGDSEMSVLIR